MSRKGNINYKYLRRRKNWFMRNIPLIIFWVVAVLVIAAGITVGVLFANGTFSIGKGGGTPDKKEEQTTAQVQTEEETRDVVWIDDVEEKVEAVTYTPPADAEFPYFIKVNRALNCVTVYGMDDKREYTIPVKAFVCSGGTEGYEIFLADRIPTIEYSEWKQTMEGGYGNYVIGISGDFKFQSVPFTEAAHDTLQTEEFNKLGESVSRGCIRMCVRDVKWIYDNCKAGTQVTIYDDATNPGPLGKPEMIKIPVDSANAKWDPTDPNPANPWLAYGADIKGAVDITTKLGEKVDLLKGVTATDTCGNDITPKIITIGHYTFDKEGTYDIKYKVTDVLGSTKEVTMKLTVTK